MTREEFDVLVKRVENEFAGKPEALRRRVIALSVIGYAGLLFWLGVVVLISCLFFVLTLVSGDLMAKIIVAVFGIIILFGGGYAVLRTLLVRVPKPEGRIVTPAEAPALFAVLSELQRQLNSARFDQVLIQFMCNAALVQVPRLGVFGWHRNYLIIGLPLLDGLSLEEMRAVLAHECSHLSRKHGRLSHWLYRLRRSWDEVFRRLSVPRARNEVTLRPIVSRFLKVFWPQFNAHAFVLSRIQEYEADSDAARVTHKNQIALALTRLRVVGRLIDEKLWPDLFQLANTQATPPDDLFQRLRDGIRRGCTPEETQNWTTLALQAASTNSDTHPCLTERLGALQAAAPDVRQPPAPSAAEAFLGGSLEKIRADVQSAWRKEHNKSWQERHARAGALKGRLSSLEVSTPQTNVDFEKLWDRAVVLLDLEGAEAAKPLIRDVLARRPDFLPALFQLGRLLLEDNNAEGIQHLEHVMTLDEMQTPKVCSLLHHYYRQAGRAVQLHQLDARMDHYEKTLAASMVERREVTAKDTFIPHGLSDVELGSVRELIASEPDIKTASLARKVCKHFPTQRMFVLCVAVRRNWLGFGNSDAENAAANRIARKLQLPGRVLVVTPSGSFSAIAKKLAKLPGLKILWR